jgi:uncharacterized protein YcsI (UPF0317 family)
MTEALSAPKSPAALRGLIRAGQWLSPTAGLAPGFAQANLVVLPYAWAYEFLLFCQRNPKPCPLLEVTDRGNWKPIASAPGADLRQDLPYYHVYQNGALVERRRNILDLWKGDWVAFLLGCSFTFEEGLLEASVPVRHIACGRNVPMYRTTIGCRPAGRFSGPMVVSMRPIPADLVVRSVQVTSRYPAVHGAPVHIGDPATIGIADLMRPDYGDPPDVRPGDVPVFWACGVTPQAVATAAKTDLMVTHAPGHMFITDIPTASLAVF